MGVLLALRRKVSPLVGSFLQDSEPRIVLEAARAINDGPIPELMPQLAKVLERDVVSELDVFTARRAMNAHFRLGTPEQAKALADFAARTAIPDSLRVEALEMLGDWEKPSGRDKIMGLWRPLAARDAQVAATALRSSMTALLKAPSPEMVQVAAIRAAARLGLDVDFMAVVAEEGAPSAIRVEALKAMAERKDGRLPEAIRLALASKAAPLRVEATKLQPKAGGNSMLAVLQKGTLAEKQAVLAALGTDPAPEAVQALKALVTDLASGKLAPELMFDVLEAAGRRSEPMIKEQVARYEANRPRNNPLAAYLEVLNGGDAEKGKKVFVERQDIACFRCHKVNGEGGEVGPELSGIGKRQTREYILESIVYPNRQIAAGFESVTVTLKSGTAYAGVLKKETDSELEIHSPEDGVLKLKKSEIKSRERGLSAMPEELVNILSKQDLRNLVEFLSSLK